MTTLAADTTLEMERLQIERMRQMPIWRKVALMSQMTFAEPFEMDELETEDLRLLYFDPPQTYLKPGDVVELGIDELGSSRQVAQAAG